MSPSSAPPPAAASLRLSPLALTVPVAMGYLPLGAVFGFLFVQAGGAPWLALLSSLVVYAGAAQYMMIPMLVAGLPVGAIVMATLVVNLRHAFYGLSLLERLPRSRTQRVLLAVTLTDETYSLLTALPPQAPPATMLRIALLNQGWWLLGTTAGVLLGSGVRTGLQGLDFVLATLFAVLTVEQWRLRRQLAPLALAVVAYGVGRWLSEPHALGIAIALCVAVGLMWPVKPEVHHA